PLFPVAWGLAERRQELPLRTHARNPAGILDQQALVGLPPEVSVGPRELARHEEPGLDDVLKQLDDRPPLLRRSEAEVLLRQTARFFDDAAPRVAPRFQCFFQDAAEIHTLL